MSGGWKCRNIGRVQGKFLATLAVMSPGIRRIRVFACALERRGRRFPMFSSTASEPAETMTRRRRQFEEVGGRKERRTKRIWAEHGVVNCISNCAATLLKPPFSFVRCLLADRRVSHFASMRRFLCSLKMTACFGRGSPFRSCSF